VIENQSSLMLVNAMRGREEQRTRRGCISYMRLYIYLGLILTLEHGNEHQKCLTS